MKNDEIPVFYTKRREQKIKIAPDDKQEPKVYTIREMLAADKEEWLENHRKRYEMDSQGRYQLTKLKGMHASLIVRCLYNEEDNLVDFSFVSQLPPTLQEKLFEICLSVTNIGPEETGDEDDKEESKKK